MRGFRDALEQSEKDRLPWSVHWEVVAWSA